MQNNKDKKEKKSSAQSKNQPSKPTVAAMETFALAGGERDPKSGTTIPSEEGVEEAREFIRENKK